MPPTREQFDERIAKLQSQVARVRAVDLSLLRSAAVKAERLTNDPAWDAFLQQIQGRIDAAESELSMWDIRLKQSYTEGDTRLAQCNWSMLKARIDTLNEIMELPARVKQTARKELTQE